VPGKQLLSRDDGHSRLLRAGVVAIVFALIILAWAAAFVQRKSGGLVLVLLSVVLLVGGGFLPPALGITAGIIGTRIEHS
jgi:hypothetical protein